MLETQFLAIAMKYPKSSKLVKVNTLLNANMSQVFVLNGCRLGVHSSTPEETRCSGLFYDKHMIHETS